MGALIVLAVLLGFIPAIIASRKGHSFFWWWLFGALLFVLVLPLSLFTQDVRARCPECAEPVQKIAKRCPHCQAEIGGRVVIPDPVP